MTVATHRHHRRTGSWCPEGTGPLFPTVAVEMMMNLRSPQGLPDRNRSNASRWAWGLIVALAIATGACSSSKSTGSSGSGGASATGTGGKASTGSGGTTTSGSGGTTSAGSGGSTGVTCGGDGQFCCAANTCNDGGCCVGNMCHASGSTCTGAGSGVTGTCNNGSCQDGTGTTCGAIGQTCCGSTGTGGTSGAGGAGGGTGFPGGGAAAMTCTASGARCANGMCEACGTSGQACCGFTCGSGLVCDFGGDAGAGATGMCSACGGGGAALLWNRHVQHGPGLRRPGRVQDVHELRRQRFSVLPGLRLPVGLGLRGRDDDARCGRRTRHDDRWNVRYVRRQRTALLRPGDHPVRQRPRLRAERRRGGRERLSGVR